MKLISFEEDRELVKLLAKAKVNHLEIFSKIDFGPKKTKMTRLFELMRDNDFHSASEVKSVLYGKEVESDGNFIRMYSKFQEKLFNTLFFVNTNSPLFTERARAYYICSKRSCIIRILIDKGWRRLAISIAELTLPISMKFEFTELTIIFSKFMMEGFSSILSNLKKYKKYKEIYSLNMDLYVKESILQKYVNDTDFLENATSNKKSLEFDSENLKDAYSKAIDFSVNFPSIEILLHSTRIIQYYFSIFKNPKLFHQKSDLILNNLLQKKFVSAGTLQSVVVTKLKNAYLEKDYPLSKQFYQNYLDKFKTGSFNWFIANYYYMLTCFNSHHFQSGFEFLQLSLSSKTFSKQPPVIQENFFVLQAYTSFLIQLNKIKLTPSPKFEFRINKFLNQVPGYSRDKQGINIPIILVQILFFLINKKYPQIIDRMESLKLYAYRYLKKDENFRSQCFIKMIAEMVRAEFKKKGTQFRTEKLLIKLKGVPVYSFPQTAETEVIPYEDLWEMIIEILD